ncbi:methylenetetrahydrofolate reductase [Actinomycetospora sp.]|jgi:methylenetetrahydrofolate reductase (NADPH)|uniref:methylenetetrahydrofolate reductase n=1 Tax=Actinomycetospora sp. TaxID=1872135 RepID=UPI002F4134EE
MAESSTGGISSAEAALLARARYEVMPLPDVSRRAVAELPRGATVTVTASPTRAPSATVAVVEQLATAGFDPVPHLAARSVRDDAELAGILARLADAGVRDVFVVGGDAREPVGRFTDALGLIEAVERIGPRPARIGVASYPDGHHRIDDATLWASLRAKQEHADYTVTQLCFDAETVGRFVAEARAHGIDLPVVAGVPGVVDTPRLLRAAVRVGVGDAMRFARTNPATAASLLRPGAYRPTGLVRGLARQVADGRCAIAGLHLYTFNEIAPTVRWLRAEQRRAAA